MINFNQPIESTDLSWYRFVCSVFSDCSWNVDV